MRSNVSRIPRRNNDGDDISQSNVVNVSKGAVENIQANSAYIHNVQQRIDSRADDSIVINSEVANLLDFLAAQQNVTREIALKKAVATAAYVYDITVNQGSKLLVQHKNKSVGEIVLK